MRPPPGRPIEIVYYTMSRKKETRRNVDPYRIWFFNGTFYLIGFCHMRDEVRVFALDRIKMLHQTKKTFEVPEDFSLEEFVRPSFGIYQGPLTKVKIRFSPEVAGYVKEKHLAREPEDHGREGRLHPLRGGGGRDRRDQVLGDELGIEGRGAGTVSLREEIRGGSRDNARTSTGEKGESTGRVCESVDFGWQPVSPTCCTYFHDEEALPIILTESERSKWEFNIVSSLSKMRK